MRADRITVGFHRIGVGAAVLLGGVPLGVIAGLVIHGAFVGASNSAADYLPAIGGFIVAGIVAYLVARGLGWIIAGFASE